MSKATSLERLMLDLVNKERAEAGLGPLRLELRLNDSAEDHSAWMIARDVFSHTGVNGTDAGARMRDAGFPFEGRWTWGENIALQSERGASGLADDVADLHRGLMNSPGHRANILNANFEVLGIGIERGDYKGFDAVVVTQNFARSGAAMRFDEGGSGSEPVAPAPDPRPAPESGNAAPVLVAEDIELRPGQFHRLAKHLDYGDADGDRVVRFEIDAPDSGARVIAGGTTVDARDGHVLDAADLASLTIQFGRSGTDQTFRMRASDGEDWSDWDSFTVRATAPKIGAVAEAPESGGLAAEADDIVLTPGERVSLADIVRVATDGDPLRSFQIKDPDGGASLWSSRRGDIDASEGAWFGAQALDRLFVVGGDEPSEGAMEIQLHDGEDRSAWESFAVTTTGWDDLA